MVPPGGVLLPGGASTRRNLLRGIPGSGSGATPASGADTWVCPYGPRKLNLKPRNIDVTFDVTGISK